MIDDGFKQTDRLQDATPLLCVLLGIHNTSPSLNGLADAMEIWFERTGQIQDLEEVINNPPP
jgi:hypothetical protein